MSNLMRRFRRLATPASLAVFLVVGSVGQAAALGGAYPNQSPGNRGVNVKVLQHLLRQHGAPIAVSGVFDDATVAAVRAFQLANGLTEHGDADRLTWVALVVPLSAGDTGDAVTGLQRLLNEKRLAGLVLTGIFDAPTGSAVKDFQRHAGLAATGRGEAGTWRALLAHLELPVWGTTLCDYSVGNGKANWGTSAAIGQLQAAARQVKDLGHGRVALGDIGFQHGGNMPGHVTHEQGLDVDVRPMRRSEDQCRWGVNWRWSTYDRAATRDLIKAVRVTAQGHVKLIYFNDPVLIKEGLVRWYAGHDDHLHVRYCEAVHQVAAYGC